MSEDCELKEGSRVEVLSGPYKGRTATITDFHLKDVGIMFEDDQDKISVRYHNIKVVSS